MTGKRLTGIFGLMIGVSISTASYATDEEDLAAMLNDFLAGASAGSAEAHDRFWDDNLVYTSSSGTRTDKPTIMASFDDAEAPTDPPPVVYTAEDVEIDVYGDTAIVAFRLVGTPTSEDGDGPAYYYNTGTFLKRADGWKVVAWQATRIPDAEDSGADE